ncbi:PREDICTED: nucleolin-like isoform X2 [Populus euphratica]|uniref:Nucleolin-like isoform X2 n=1 Tax=Populus euphratica TaxID=75702 RepID=A0AAJ6TTU3_POPEU|nr:PREDICTED: nucleolin-like isoform X2 [Populus euphratica]
MPPRAVKRGAAAAAGKKRTLRKGPSQQHREVAEDMLNLEVKPTAVDEKPVVVEEEKSVFVEDKLVIDEKKDREGEIEANLVANEPTSLKKEEEGKESVDEYEKDERLDFDDNEPEYDPEEYGGGDYDDKEIEQEDVQEVEDEVEEEHEEENVGEEEQGDLVEEELEEDPEEHEGEEDDEHAGEEVEHAEMADVEEEDEHHEVFKERRKRKEFEVFVGGLDKDATEDDLRKIFSRVGEVTEVRLMMNPQTKKNKGFAFLRFATVEQAKRAVTELKNPVINGKQCGVTPSQDSDTLFLGNICKTWTKEALKEKLKHYGVENVKDLTLVEDSNNAGMNRGFAFLEFSSRSDAMDAFKRLQKRDVLFGVDRPAKVSFADSFIDPGDEIMAQVKTVFIDGLPASWDEDRVRVLLKKYGEIEKIELARNMPSARRKDFGFVTFDTHDAAVTCAKSINNAELGEGDNKAKVRARLSRPLQRGKGKHLSRGDFRPGYGASRVVKGPWVRPMPHSYSTRPVRGIANRAPPFSLKSSTGLRERRPPVMSMPARSRPLAPPSRSFERRPPPPSYAKSLKREYGRRDEPPPSRSRPAVDYDPRSIPERRPSYRDEYSSRGTSYADLPRSTSRMSARRAYADDGYSQRYERPPPSYREGHGRDYDSVAGSKRPYPAMDDIPPRYADAGVRHSRPRLDYELGSSASQYGDAYGDRLGRSAAGYGGSRSSISSQDSHGMYSSRQGMGYGGSYGGNDGGMYSSSYGGDYMSRSGDVGGSSYSSMYSSRGGMGSSSSYMGTGSSGSYY